MARLIKTPGSVITAAVFLYIYGSLMLLCLGCSAVEFAMIDGNDPINRRIAQEVPGYDIVHAATAFLNLPTGVIMILTANGLLKLRPVARLAAYVITSIEILLALLSSSYTAFLIIPAQDRIMAEEAQNLPPEVGAIMGLSMWGGLGLALGLVLVFCVPVLFLLSGPRARAAFASEEFDMPRDFRRRRHDDDADNDEGHHRPPAPPGSPSDTGITEREK